MIDTDKRIMQHNGSIKTEKQGGRLQSKFECSGRKTSCDRQNGRILRYGLQRIIRHWIPTQQIPGGQRPIPAINSENAPKYFR